MIHDCFRGKWLGSALQIYFIADNLAMLVGPMVNTLFIRQCNNSLAFNCCPQRLDINEPSKSFEFANFTSCDNQMVQTLNTNHSPSAHLTPSGAPCIHSGYEYTMLVYYYVVPTVSMVFASLVSFYAFSLSKTVKTVLHSRVKGDRPENKSVDVKRNFNEIILLTGLVFLLGCRTIVAKGGYGLMVTYMVKHLKMGKTTASQVTSSWSLASLLSQLVGIILIRVLPAPAFLGISYFIAMIVNLVVTFTVDDHKGLIWVWAVLTGALLPSIMISIYSWFYQSVSITTFRTSLILVGQQGGSIVGTSLIGYMMTIRNPGWFMFTLDGILAIANIIFLITLVHYYFSKRNGGYELLK